MNIPAATATASAPSPAARRAVRNRQVTAALVVAVASAGALAGAWYFQLVVGLAPCPLCLEQRIPYYIAVPVALIGAVCAAFGRQGPARVALALCGMLMALGAFLAVYHAGVEWAWWAGPDTCSGAGPALGGGNLLGQLQSARVVRCDEAAWRLLGLSLAGYNAFIAGALTVVAMWGASAKA
ncbi:disulfide bond formation protein B [Ancylobacter rudongensis]|uniref:Disulfide bond formation protein DsbB n=1 Tax=Ancylobacter rudongensis TaxID=177413 RepID=A0A1G4UB07_9HYPH|nr:disulfide bond formation protein B [Ancylobacter rudongensis]SCW90810.1 disulfide bond formation protein DsbB [Ancylobacter rudongensis]